ncbi:putative Ig domain-containing protein [Pinibacter aurantiacus]|uniref:Ig domain-containing protein n=1 Tax=Pinibacter aurantiacus TaxID=2851599 RepID=A0A9E2S8I6_9BACT|nr:putative Ig domain-containing protein [Pinibacter aurantiacus]MBV4357552.1 putative Ig domain-containing protein [Pinibacter aurantiacus]
MNRHFFSLIFLLLLQCMMALGQRQQSISLPAAKFVTGDNTQWSMPGFNDKEWKTIKTGTVWQEQGFADYHGYAWYRIHIVIPSRMRLQSFWKDSLCLYLAHVNDVDETYLNGRKIGKTGAFPEDAGGYVSKWPAVRAYHIAASDPAIKWDKENVIAIKVYDGGGSGGIFMGNPSITMLEKIDGTSIGVMTDSTLFDNAKAIVPVKLSNDFNTRIEGALQVKVIDNFQQKVIQTKTVKLTIEPFSKKIFSFTVPNKAGISFNSSFIDNSSKLSVTNNQSLAYILTPKASGKPQINSASAFGVRPASPVLFRVAASGNKPMQYFEKDLPAGLQLDSSTGIVTGSIKQKGDYIFTVGATNNLGVASKQMVIKIGDQLALTPPMGWNSWNCWGIIVSADKVKSSAQALIDKGLIDYGWSYINIDDGWEAPERNVDGTIATNEKFGNMKELGDWLHSNGLKFGIYSSPGPRTCGGYLGSYQHEKQDADSYASWGIDYLKYDWCSYDGIVGKDTTTAAYIKPYTIMSEALRAQPRDIVYSLCQYGMKDVWKWGPQVNGQSWRTTEDIEDTWQSLYSIGFHQDRLFSYAGPGHWNDPDMMIVGQVGWGENLHPSRLTPDEQYTHVTLWSLLSAPLLIGCDLSKLDNFTLQLLTNSEVIAVNQDLLGKQAQRVFNTDSTQVWMKELESGEKAIGIFNMSTKYRTVKVTWDSLGLTAPQQVRNIWRQQNVTANKLFYTAELPPHGVAFIKVVAKK